MMKRFEFYPRTRLVFGAGCLNELATLSLPGKKALIVTTNGGSVKRNGTLDRVVDALGKQGIESVVFDQVSPNPLAAIDMEGAKAAKEQNCDFVIGLGGGSAIDSAKLIAFMATNPGDLTSYLTEELQQLRPSLPIVSITTTSGTGSELDPFAVASMPERKEKIGFFSETNFPKIAIVDPELMVSCPPRFTALQGFDTLCHLSENYISTQANPITEMLSLKGIELVGKYLPRAVEDGSDLEARTQLALACSYAGYVLFSAGTGSQHPMEHSLSAYHEDIPHGAGLAMLYETYFTFFADKADNAGRYAEMAKAMGVDVDRLPESERAMAYVKAVAEMMKKIGIYDLKMSDYGITREELVKFAEDARRTGVGSFEENDRYHLSMEETVGIYERAYK